MSRVGMKRDPRIATTTGRDNLENELVLWDAVVHTAHNSRHQVAFRIHQTLDIRAARLQLFDLYTGTQLPHFSLLKHVLRIPAKSDLRAALRQPARHFIQPKEKSRTNVHLLNSGEHCRTRNRIAIIF
jgi:hypothetical protein